MGTTELYLCDPEKNTACSKTRCAYNICSQNRVCRATTNPDFSVLDHCGNPVFAKTALWTIGQYSAVLGLGELTQEVKNLSSMIVKAHEQSADNGTEKRIKKLEASVASLFGLFFGQLFYLFIKLIFSI